jgi:hypothetical protein
VIGRRSSRRHPQKKWPKRKTQTQTQTQTQTPALVAALLLLPSAQCSVQSWCHSVFVLLFGRRWSLSLVVGCWSLLGLWFMGLVSGFRAHYFPK